MYNIALVQYLKKEEADAYFPDEKVRWLFSEKYHPKDEEHKSDFTFITYSRKWKSS